MEDFFVNCLSNAGQYLTNPVHYAKKSFKKQFFEIKGFSNVKAKH